MILKFFRLRILGYLTVRNITYAKQQLFFFFFALVFCHGKNFKLVLIFITPIQVFAVSCIILYYVSSTHLQLYLLFRDRI